MSSCTRLLFHCPSNQPNTSPPPGPLPIFFQIKKKYHKLFGFLKLTGTHLFLALVLLCQLHYSVSSQSYNIFLISFLCVLISILISKQLFYFTKGMTALVDRVIQASIPSYDLSLGNDVLFNASDVGEDESKFMVSRYKVAQAVRDRQKINMVSHSLILTGVASHYFYETHYFTDGWIN